jgi:hypothetical protein
LLKHRNDELADVLVSMAFLVWALDTPFFNQEISSVNQCTGDRQSGVRRLVKGDTVILWRPLAQKFSATIGV